MKRGIIFLFIIFAYFALALEIQIIAPPTGTLPSTNVTFVCNVSQEFSGETLANLSVYHDINGTMDLFETKTGIGFGQHTFTDIDNISSGSYNWRCDASNTVGGYTTMPSSFTIPSTGNAPVITSYSPAELNFTVDLYNSTRFKINASDAENDTITVQWAVNGAIKQQEEELYEFGYTPKVSGKNFTIRVRVSDGETYTEMSWIVEVLFVNTTTTEPETNITANETSSETNQSSTNATTTTETTQPSAEPNITITTPKGKCGDGREDPEENCENCPEDASCPVGYECKDGSCILEEKSSNTLIIVIVLSSFIIFAFLSFIGYKKYKERQIFPSDTEILKEKPITKKEQLPQLEPPKTPKKPLTRSNLAILRNYIDENLQRGRDFSFIKTKLLKTGWTEEQISEAILSFKNERINTLQRSKKTS